MRVKKKETDVRKDYVDLTWGSAAALIELEVYETAYFEGTTVAHGTSAAFQ